MSALYIHIPFCKRKCSYCDFYSCENIQFADDFLTSLSIEMNQYKALMIRSAFDTLYIGGGTPSLLTVNQIQQILSRLKQHFIFTQDTETSIEVNPGTISEDKLSDYLKSGINRLSIGVQSFHNDELRFMGRIHQKETAIHTFKMARSEGFKNIGIDLIYGLPNQKMVHWKDSVNRALDLQPDHISTYALTWSDKTPLGRSIADGILPVPDDNLVSDMFLWTDEALADAGYTHYEISNYAKPGRECRHNWHYWDGAAYLGLGPSAHSYNQQSRWWNIPDVNIYIKRLENGLSVISEKEDLSEKEIRTERIALGLRTNRGILQNELDQKSNFHHLLHQNLAVQKKDRIVLTPKGMLLADEIASQLI